MSHDINVDVTVRQLGEFGGYLLRLGRVRELLEADKQGQEIIKRLCLFTEEDVHSITIQKLSDADDSENEEDSDEDEDSKGTESDGDELVPISEAKHHEYLGSMKMFKKTVRKLKADKEGRAISKRLTLFYESESESEDEPAEPSPQKKPKLE